MPSPTIVASGGAYRLYDGSVQTFDQLPAGTYSIEFSPMTGYSLRDAEPLEAGDEKVYGDHLDRVRRISHSYQAMSRSLGVILSGDKGMGKSLMIRMLAERMREEHSLPVVLVQQSTPGLAAFLDELGDAVVVFDEFEKIFPNSGEQEAQNQFLSLFDGLSTTKRLYVLSVNNLHLVNDFMLNRPGRFHYHMRFNYPDQTTIENYLTDQVPNISTQDVMDIIEFSRKYNLNFDHLRAIAFELNLGERFADVIGDLNIKRLQASDQHVELRLTQVDGEVISLACRIDLFDLEGVQRVTDYASGFEIAFRVRDAVSTAEGYQLQPNHVQVISLDDDKPEPPKFTKILLRRAVHAQMDFAL